MKLKVMMANQKIKLIEALDNQRKLGYSKSIDNIFLHFVCKGSTINPFPNKPWFLRVCSTSLLKTLWERVKLLIMSNFSFSHSVFYPFG